MNIKLEDIELRQSGQSEEWKLHGTGWKMYRLEGVANDGVRVGRLNVTVAVGPPGQVDVAYFYRDNGNGPLVPKPYVSFQETEPEFRGQGLSGRLIVLANELFKGRFGSLFSDTLFYSPSARRVWEKLQERGVAVCEPHRSRDGVKKDRWFVK